MNETAVQVGHLYGVGAGPGAPDLLTLRAQRVLTRVPLVCVPAKSRADESYAYAIVRALIDPAKQQVLKLIFPMHRDTQQLASNWEEAAETIWQHLAVGQDCAFITEGDPLLYSTFIYLSEALRSRHPEVIVEVVPGVSSINAAAAQAFVPLATGDECVAILPATCERAQIESALRSFDTVVLMKPHRVLDQVLAILEESGLADRAVCVSRCTRPDEVIVRDIRTLKDKPLDYFSLLIVRR